MESARANAHEDKEIFHHDHRKDLLAQAAEAVGATYGTFHGNCHHAPLTLRHTDYEPSRGSTPLDVTAVHKDQLSWGGDIRHRPVELLSFYPPAAENVSNKAIGNLKYDDKLLLDFRGKPLKDFPSLPLVISSTVEGWRVEAWARSDSRMSITDIIARIPVKCTTDSAGCQNLMPMVPSGTVRARAGKFRDKAGLITWKQGKDQKIERFMDELRSPTEVANNQALGRDLSVLEKASMAKINVGTRPDRATSREDPVAATRRYIDSVQKRSDQTFDFDCRTERPETPEEIQDIQNALQQTYSDFALYTNVPLEVPNTQDSYLDQWNCMQVQLNRIWAKDRTKKIEPPQLFALGKWTVSFDNWVSAPQAYLTYVRK